jgi:hypothetical protein
MCGRIPPLVQCQGLVIKRLAFRAPLLLSGGGRLRGLSMKGYVRMFGRKQDKRKLFRSSAESGFEGHSHPDYSDRNVQFQLRRRQYEIEKEWGTVRLAPARHPQTGAPTELQEITDAQIWLSISSDEQINDLAVGAGGWDAFTANRPEDVMFLYQDHGHHRTAVVKAAAEGALRRAGYLPNPS